MLLKSISRNTLLNALRRLDANRITVNFDDSQSCSCRSSFQFPFSVRQIRCVRLGIFASAANTFFVVVARDSDLWDHFPMWDSVREMHILIDRHFLLLVFRVIGCDACRIYLEFPSRRIAPFYFSPLLDRFTDSMLASISRFNVHGINFPLATQWAAMAVHQLIAAVVLHNCIAIQKKVQHFNSINLKRKCQWTMSNRTRIELGGSV